MPRQKQKKDVRISPGVVFDTKVVVLKKTPPPQAKPQTVPGVSSSVKYNRDTDTLIVTRFPVGFGKRVRAAREALSMNQKQLAAKISKPATVIADIEKEGAIYDKDLVLRIEKACNIKFDPKYHLK